MAKTRSTIDPNLFASTQADKPASAQGDKHTRALTVYVDAEVWQALDRRWHEAALAGDKVTKSAIVEAALRAALGLDNGTL